LNQKIVDRKNREKNMSDYKEVIKLEESGELPKDSNTRWEEGYDHHQKSERLMQFMKDYD